MCILYENKSRFFCTVRKHTKRRCVQKRCSVVKIVNSKLNFVRLRGNFQRVLFNRIPPLCQENVTGQMGHDQNDWRRRCRGRCLVGFGCWSRSNFGEDALSSRSDCIGILIFYCSTVSTEKAQDQGRFVFRRWIQIFVQRFWIQPRHMGRFAKIYKTQRHE